MTAGDRVWWVPAAPEGLKLPGVYVERKRHHVIVDVIDTLGRTRRLKVAPERVIPRAVNGEAIA